MVKTNLTAERLRELLHYNPDTGIFTRLVALNFKVNIGDSAGTKLTKGYISVSVDGTKYRAHRLAWLYMRGTWPKDQIDHINGVRDDNRFSNLREASNSENMQNMLHKYSSGNMGTHFRKDVGMWAAAINTRGNRRHLGLFETRDLAVAAYQLAKKNYHEFCPAVRLN